MGRRFERRGWVVTLWNERPSVAYKYAGFSGPHPSLVVECPTCGSPAMHYCREDGTGRPKDRPCDARREAAGTTEQEKP